MLYAGDCLHAARNDFMEKKPLKIRPNQEQIALWERVVLEWLPILAVDERLLVWKRANRIPWKLLCREFGVSRQMLAVRYERALIKSNTGAKCH